MQYIRKGAALDVFKPQTRIMVWRNRKHSGMKDSLIQIVLDM